MLLLNHNPDVLNCIANLSNDEVFTPPELANAMLDQVADAWAAGHDGASIWEDATVKFLDPFAKSGVFLREITRRLEEGLVAKIPDRQERVNHILTKQVYGIAITNLTAMLTRRSVYCSKWANSEHSVCTAFDDDKGNIWFERTEHTWAGGKPERRVHPTTGEELTVYINRRCTYCGVGETDYDRGDERESHAYALIHADNPQQLIKNIFGESMQFDVVIGNPPYQMSDGGAGKSARPLYQLFVENSKRLDPRYISLIIPSRWMAGGKGLDEFRKETLSDERFRKIVDFIDSNEAFQGVDIAGGVSYFLWDRDNPGTCDVETHIRGRVETSNGRKLNDYDIFIRYAKALSIVKKIWPNGVDFSDSLQSRMSGRNAFGFSTKERGHKTKAGIDNPVKLISSAGTSYVPRAAVTNNSQWIDLWKATVSRASPAGGRPDKDGKFYGLSSIAVVAPGSVTTEAYPVVGAFETLTEAERMCDFLRTKLVRFLLTLRSVNQSVGRQTFGFVPDLPMDKDWTDDLLNKKYALSEDEIAFIDSMIRPMEAS